MDLIDLPKAYNNSSHFLIIQDLYDMHLPGWLLAIVFSYLSGRTMTLNYDGVWSEERKMPGSFGQGCYLMMLLFIVKFNGALLRPSIAQQLRSHDEQQTARMPECVSEVKTAKFIDNCSVAAAVN